MSGSVGYGVFDTACIKTVAGTEWMNEHLACLTEQECVNIKRFGDGVE